MSTYTIHVDHQDFVIKTEDLSALDIHQNSATDFHLLKDNQAFKVELIAENVFEKTMTISVNGNRYDIKIDDAYDTMVKKMGLLEKIEALSNDVTAPMPGYIVDIMVKAGDIIEDGTPLFVLSAMKMENVILSDGKGVVKKIEAKKDDTVVKGQLIIEMEG
jgi:biotin carboxyl carrier protein